MDLPNAYASGNFLPPPYEMIQVNQQAPEQTPLQVELHSNHDAASKSVKRRASQACESCRTRKIRCDVAKHGVPCVHCKLDEVECVIGENKRKR